MIGTEEKSGDPWKWWIIKRKWWYGMIGILFGSLWIFLTTLINDKTIHFAIIPHFMIASEKVDQFYAMIQKTWYEKSDPDYVLIISPNHFYPDEKTPQTFDSLSCFYQETKYQLSAFPGVSDKGQLAKPFWKSFLLKEHGIWEHLSRIQKYFPSSEVVVLSLPTHLPPTERLQDLPFKWKILVIASVDFAHYQPEEQTYQHDLQSIDFLTRGNGDFHDFVEKIDADCPACLFLINHYASQQGQKAFFRYRDSSSALVGKDLKEENTSRIFMWYE